MIERSACRVDEIADSVLKDVLSIRAIPDRGRGQVLPTRREVAGPIRVGKASANSSELTEHRCAFAHPTVLIADI